MTRVDRPEINMSSIKVAGVGGLGLVAVVVAMAVEMPVIRAFAIISLVGGIVGGTAFIGYRRWIKPDPPHGPTLMVGGVAERVRQADREGPDTLVKLSPIASAK